MKAECTLGMMLGAIRMNQGVKRDRKDRPQCDERAPEAYPIYHNRSSKSFTVSTARWRQSPARPASSLSGPLTA